MIRNASTTPQPNYYYKKQGFSLVELSIVLVILGLLIGGILSGQALIRASELRAVSTEQSRYVTAVQTFRDKYFAIPGDMANATSFWGKDNTNCPSHTGTAATPGTCNGDGDGYILAWSPNEMHRFWQELALAGLIEGSYTGMPGVTGGAAITSGVNAPKSKLGNAGWGTMSSTVYDPVGDGYWYGGINHGNYLIFGADSPTATYPNLTPALAPEEAWNIDTKVDDGKPATGRVIPTGWAACTTSTTSTDATGTYKLAENSKQCTLLFIRQF
jgi:prepilin-type N-terminal cleavage/methylation domain-containing protein